MDRIKIGTAKYLGKDHQVVAVEKQWQDFIRRGREFRIKKELAYNTTNIQILYDRFCTKKLDGIIQKHLYRLSNKVISIPFYYTDGSVKYKKSSINSYLREINYKPCTYKIDNYQGSWGINEPVLRKKQFVLHFNINLIKFDSGHKIGYVVAHELAHVVERNHNKSFYELVERLYPGARRYERFWNTR